MDTGNRAIAENHGFFEFRVGCHRARQRALSAEDTGNESQTLSKHKEGIEILLASRVTEKAHALHHRSKNHQLATIFFDFHGRNSRRSNRRRCGDQMEMEKDSGDSA